MATEKYKTNWQKALAQTRTIASEIRERRGDEPLKPTPEEMIHQMREDRDEQLHQYKEPVQSEKIAESIHWTPNDINQ